MGVETDVFAGASQEMECSAAAVAPFLHSSAQLKDATCDRSIAAKSDSFGNEGTLVLEKFDATAVSLAERDELVQSYLEDGFRELPRDALKDDDQVRLRLDQLDPSNPFVWEHDVEIAVGGRSLVGSQRKVLAAKMKSLREELGDEKLAPRRREQAEKMVEELSVGLLLRLSVHVSRRSFVMKPLLTTGTVVGTLLPLGYMSQVVYRVMPAEPDEREEDDGEPLYLTFLGADARQVSFLFSGGILGQRTITDLDDGLAHNAWFQNRQLIESPDTAPWVSRGVYRSLRDTGESALVVRWGREDVPIHIAAKGSENVAVNVLGEEKSFPTLVAETEKEDRLWILEDQDSPLVLRMIEGESELLRTIDEVRKLEAF